MKPEIDLPVERVVNGEKTFDLLDRKAVMRYEPDQSIFRVTLKIRRHLMLWLEEWDFQNQVSAGFKHPVQLRHYFFRILDVFQDRDAKNRVEII